uniref:Uncharacterized protein n=1 Tax=viral metagenome TaxID=1070528 RepID=A0A6C0JHR1_9ZZZZ
MAFFDINTSMPVKPTFLTYKFPDVTLFNSGSWTTLKSEGVNYVYKITYPNTSADTAIKFVDNSSSAIYKPTFMQICGVVHNNITGLTSTRDKNTIVGELIIECASNTTSSKLYICIFLKAPEEGSTNFNKTSIDNIVNMILSDKKNQSTYITSTSVKLDMDLPTDENCIIYKDGINTVIMLTQPIQLADANVSKIIAKLDTNTSLFKISAPNKKVDDFDEKDRNHEKIINNPDDIYIDCKPTGSSVEEITTYNIPIDSDFTKDAQQMDFMKTSMNFFIFIIGLVVVYVAVPSSYKLLVIDKVNKAFPDNAKKILRVRSADIWLFLVFVGGIISLASKSTSENKYSIYALYMAIFYGLSFSLIQFNKAGKSSDFLKTINNGDITYPDETKPIPFDSGLVFKQFNDLLELLGSAFAFFFITSGIPVFVIVCIITFVLLILRYAVGLLSPEDFEFYCKVLLTVIPIFVSLFLYFCT